MLKLALVQIAQGKHGEALALLEAARGALDAADHGLALALAGQPNEAIAMLEPAARQAGADSRVRQNLALAYAFAGDWTAARTIASQDVPADQLDARIQQWMVLAKPAKASDQVAALIGVTPAVDPGQPVRLALKGTDARMAELVPMTQPVDRPRPRPVEWRPSKRRSPHRNRSKPRMVAPQPEPHRTPSTFPPRRLRRAGRHSSSLRRRSRSPAAPRAAPPVRKASAPVARPAFRRAALPLAKSINTVVQLAAYDSRAYVADGWNRLSRRHAVAARLFAGGREVQQPARGWSIACRSRALPLPAKRRACASRSSARAPIASSARCGDAPVRIASR